MKTFLPRLAWLVAAWFVELDFADAATKTWTGSGTTANWSTSANWNPSGAPVNGDTLVFPSGASRLTNTNNISNLRISSIQITDDSYILRGNSLTLSNGMLITYGAGSVTVAFDVVLGGNQNWDNRGPLTSFTGDLDLNGNNFIGHARDATESFIFSGTITGSGNVTYSGDGLLTLQGALANTYSGTTTVSGDLRLNKNDGINAVPHALIVQEGGSATWFHSDQIPDSAIVTVEGSLDLNDEDETVGGLDLEDASIITGTGVLTLGGGVTNRASTSASIIVGTLHLGSFTRTFFIEDGSVASDLLIAGNVRGGSLVQFFAGINKLGGGALVLSGSNSFGGTITVREGEVRALNNDALGTVAGGTIVSNNATLTLDTVGTISEPLTLAGNGIGGTNAALRVLGGTSSDLADVTLAGATRIFVDDGAIFTFGGEIGGTGPLVKDGFGDLYLSGSSGNTFTGGADVEEGAAHLNKTSGNAIPGDVEVGKDGFSLGGTTPALLRNLRDHQISGSVTVRGDGTWNLNNHDETIVDLILSGSADVTTGTGILSLQDITASPDLFLGGGSTIDGFLNLSPVGHTITVSEGAAVLGPSDPTELEISASIIGSGGFTKTGSGDLWLTSSNTFAGNATVNQGELRVGKDRALGNTIGGTIVTGTGVLTLMEKVELITYGGVRITNETVLLDSVGEPGKGVVHCSDYVAIWNGPVILQQTAVINTTTNATYENWANLNIEGDVSGPGGITKVGPGGLIMINFGVNSYEGTTTVNEGKLRVGRLTTGAGIPGDLVVGDGIGGPDSDVVEVGFNNGVFFSQIRTNANVHINSSGLLRMQVRAPTSPLSLTGSGRLDIVEADTITLGIHNGTYTFDGIISGNGVLGKTGAGTVTLNGNNPFSGETGSSQGMLRFNGTHLNSKVLVSALGGVGGSGQLAELEAFSSTRVAPGNSAGRLRASDVYLRPNAIFDIELNGPNAGTNYDQLTVSGPCAISNAILRVALGYLPSDGQVFKIIDKTSAGPVLGTFVNGGEGTLLNIEGFEMVLSYEGGDGNDVTLTVTNRYWEFESAVVTMGNGNGYIDPNECNHLKVFIRCIWDGLGISASDIKLDSDTPGITITHQEWSNGIIQPNTLLSNAKPIQFRTAPWLQCGTFAKFSLTIRTGSYLRIPFSIYIPPSGGFYAFNSTNAPLPVPDSGSVTSVIHVPNNPAYSLVNVDQLRLTVHATHPRASDLRFRLITPRGTNILLSANRGGSGTNYGIGCAFNEVTMFSDAAANSITTASAPFVGQFKPEEQLSLAKGEPLVGTWQLLVEDSVGGNAGTLQCWRLELVPPFCQDDGGGCESCGGTISGTLGANQMQHRLRLSGDEAAICGWLKSFPGTNATPGPFRYNLHLFTNTGPTTCVSVLLKNTCTNTGSALMASAYTNFFDPANIRTNYAGDTGFSNALTAQLSVRVVSNQVVAIVVNDTQPAASSTCTNYTLEVFGLPCTNAPRLEITRDANPDKVRLFWSTGYPQHQLDREPVLTTPPSFVSVTNSPVVMSGKYAVTNTMSITQGFYRLRKP